MTRYKQIVTKFERQISYQGRGTVLRELLKANYKYNGEPFNILDEMLRNECSLFRLDFRPDTKHLNASGRKSTCRKELDTQHNSRPMKGTLTVVLVCFILTIAVETSFCQLERINSTIKDATIGFRQIEYIKSMYRPSVSSLKQKSENPPGIKQVWLGFLIGSKGELDKGGSGLSFGFTHKISPSVFSLGFNAFFTYFFNDTRSNNFVNTSIPHNDYKDAGLQNSWGLNFSVLGILRPSSEASLFVGFGTDFISATKVVKSNVTDLYWNQGNEFTSALSQMIGCDVFVSSKVFIGTEYFFRKNFNYLLLKCGAYFM